LFLPQLPWSSRVLLSFPTRRSSDLVCESKAGSGMSKEDAAVIIGLVLPNVPPAFLASTTISDSANAGVYRGWQVSDIDFVPGNTDRKTPRLNSSHSPTPHAASSLTK